MILLSFLFVYLCLERGVSQGIGESCNQNGAPGVCVTLGRCPSVLADPRKRRTTQRCGFYGNEPILCCTDRELLADRFVATPAPIRSTTTEYIPTLAVYQELFPEDNGGKCAPILAKHTSPKTGRKAFDKCIEYQERLVYPCERGVDITGKMSRGNNCLHNADDLIVGGKDAKRDEFPHMALLGYGEGPASNKVCGGTVISENFILTAGHCTYSRGPVTTAKVGLLRQSEDVPARRVYRIKRVIKHPQYNPPSKYHDIALLETETPITLDRSTIPACLDIGDRVDDSRASATGWGHNQSFGDVLDVLQKASHTRYFSLLLLSSLFWLRVLRINITLPAATDWSHNKTFGKVLNVLQKVTLQKFSAPECTASFRGVRHLDYGYDERTQVCFGDHEEKKDTCQGDSGGPLQIHSQIHCMYTVIGVTSFGKYCGQLGRPGMYTRVSAYTSWIESVVWP